MTERNGYKSGIRHTEMPCVITRPRPVYPDRCVHTTDRRISLLGVLPGPLHYSLELIPLCLPQLLLLLTPLPCVYLALIDKRFGLRRRK